MNFLQLCQRLAHEAGVNGPGPTTVVGQNGSLELGRVVNWINDAWLDIQGSRHWSWMWTNAPLTLTAGSSTIAAGLPAERFDKDSAYFADGSPAGRLITFLPWHEFRHDHRVLGSADHVTAWTVRPDNSLAFNALASVDRTITIERWANPTSMTVDADIPGLPEDLHMLIVWRALIKYANFDEAGVQRSTAVEEHNQKWQALVTRCLPEMSLGGPLGDE